MKLKDKFAATLRRWASKLSPETNPYLSDIGLRLPSPIGLAYYEVKRLGSIYAVSRNEENKALIAQQQRYYPDAVKRMREEYKERIAHAIVARLWEDGVIEYTEERNPETGELRIGGYLYVGIRKDNENENTNPFNN